MSAAKAKPADLPHWPRLLSREQAAAYVGLSVGSLRLIPVSPVRIGTRVLYDRCALDAYADTLVASGQTAASDEEWLSRLT